MHIVEKKVKLTDIDIIELLGVNEANLQLIENKFDTAITVRGDTVVLRGEPIEVKKIEQNLKNSCTRSSALDACKLLTCR